MTITTSEAERGQFEPASIAQALAAACERQRAGQSFGEAGATLKRIVAARRRTLATEFARGDIAAARLSQTIDQAIVALWTAGAAQHGDAAGKLAVAAVGGYGRGLLAPFSDIDLVFLHADAAHDVKALLDFMLYPLWDAGLKVGHATHSPRSAVQFAQRDMTARTSFLDARRLAGSERVWRDFAQRYDTLRKGTKKKFAADKEREREARHRKSEQSRFLAEPDLKEGKGGLRDLHAMRWLYKYENGCDIEDPRARKRILSAQDVKLFKRAERFLWSVRVQLHALRGRAEEKLTFDVQPALAEQLGYADRGEMKAAERLMRHYFVNAMEIGRLSRVFSAKVEEERLKLTPGALKVLPKSLIRDEAGEKPNLKLQGGRLHFQNAARAGRNPVDLFRLFRAYSRRPDFDFHPDALTVVSASAPALAAAAREDPVVAKLFIASLTEGKDPARLLRVMAETGLLGKYIPSFGKIIGRIEYGLYRRFSIDENAFQAIGVLSEIVRGEAGERHPIATSIIAGCDDLAPYYVALLLHETNWSMREASPEAAEKLIARIAVRLGLAPDQAALAAWCAARHALMSETAERRNLAEAAAIARFAETVGSRQRLDLLLVLAVCHNRVVGAHSWDDWTRRQITALYEGASAWLEGGDAALTARQVRRAAEARDAASTLLSAWTPDDRRAALARLSDAVLKAAEPALIARIADLTRAAANEGAAAAVSARLSDGVIEAIVYADDRTGLLADLAGAIAVSGASVRTVQVTTTSEGKAIDVFTIQSTDGAPLEDPEVVRALHAKLLAAAQGPPRRAPNFSRRLGDRRAMFVVQPKVRIDADASPECLIVETEGQDRPGLLYDLCVALAELKTSIRSAHVATYGARAIDAFYITGADGRKVMDPARIRDIEKRLIAALGDGGGPRTPLTVRP